MTRIFFRRRTPLLFVLTLLLVSFACKFFTGGPEAEVPAAGVPTPEEAITVDDLVFGPGEFILPDTKAGLADLNSYKATLILSFNGTRAGKTEQWSKTYIMLTSKELVERQLTIEKTGDLSDLDAVFMAELNGAGYERIGENSCTAILIEQGNSLGERLEPAGFLTGVRGAEKAGSETVNAVAANHYTFDERAFGQLDITDSTGEMWVASDGGYIVKYLLTTQGNTDYFGEGLEGTLTWNYELTNINGPVTVTLPDNCPAGLVNVPTLTDATDILNMPGVLTYHTSTSPADAASFYQQEIPNLGWELTGEPTLTDTTALLDFTQGDQTLTILITVDNSRTTVHVIQGHSQE